MFTTPSNGDAFVAIWSDTGVTFMVSVDTGVTFMVSVGSINKAGPMTVDAIKVAVVVTVMSDV